MSGLHRAGLRIDLRGPTIFSHSAATTGGHASLDAIPGAALLGLAASWQEAWEAGLSEPVWTVLRSGTVRFGPGYPIDAQGRVLLPVPRALHQAKAATNGREADGRILHNLSSGTVPAGLQLNQVREGYLAEGEEGLSAARARKVFVMKTAVDPESGSAMDAMLFGYEALAPGQSFYAEIEADADLDAATFEALVGTLASPEGRAHRMGRSRAAEFGAVTIRRVPERREGPVRALGDRLVLWALSDLALVDASGQPTLDPASADLGLRDVVYRPEHSFLGTRRYAPYVGRWRCSDLERYVISAGSVLVFAGPGAAAAAERLQAGGLGVERAAGLGRVWVNPPSLDAPMLGALPDWHRLPVSPAIIRPEPVDNPLFAWLDARTQARGLRTASDEAVAAAVQAALAAYASAEAYSGLRPDGFAGPSRSQWNQVASAAREARDPDGLEQALFGAEGIVSGRRDRLGQARTDPAWGWPVAPDRDHATALRTHVAELRSRGLDVPRTLAAIAQGVAAGLGALKVRSSA